MPRKKIADVAADVKKAAKAKAEKAVDTAAATEVEVKKSTRSVGRKAKAKVEEVAAQVAEKVDAAATAVEIEAGKAKAKRTRKTAEVKKAVSEAVEEAKKPARKARAAKLDIVIQSVMGGAITPKRSKIIFRIIFSSTSAQQVFQLSLWNVVPILFIPVITGLSVHHICENHFFVRFANGDDGKRTDKSNVMSWGRRC